jgi:hypothetical protein
LYHINLLLCQADYNDTNTKLCTSSQILPTIIPSYLGLNAIITCHDTAGHHMEETTQNCWAVGLCLRDCADVRRRNGSCNLRAYCVLLVVPLCVHVPVTYPVQPSIQPWSRDLPYLGWKQGKPTDMTLLLDIVLLVHPWN